MQMKLEIPDSLVSRLHRHEGQLPLILELGLDELSSETDADVPRGEDGLPSAWLDSLGELAGKKRRNLGSGLPEAGELVAYYEGELEDDERDRLQEKLALDPDSRRELLDLSRFESLEPPREEHRLSERDVDDALARLHARLGERPEQPAPEPEAPESEQTRVVPFPPATTKRIPAWAAALAATFLLVIGGVWIGTLYDQLEQRSGVQHARIIDLSNVRGARTFKVSPDAEQILLILPAAKLGEFQQGVLEISLLSGQQIYRDKLTRTEDDESLLRLELPRQSLPDGTYRITLSALGAGSSEHARYDFEIITTPSD